MNFLGNVNIFHGRVESGRAVLGPLALDYPAHPDASPHPAAGYARPYELDLSRRDEGGGLWARLLEVNTTAGGTVKLELLDDDGRAIQVELSRDRHAEFGPVVGERLYVKPRKIRVFLTSPSQGGLA